MLSLITQHPAVFAIFDYWLFSAFVGGMPEPSASSSAGYRWLHNSLHILAGNLSTAVSAHYPALTLPTGTAVQQSTQTTVVTAKN